MIDVITVAELTAHIRRLFDDEPGLRDVWVEGEVSNFRRVASGHCYFTLKDSAAQIACVMWRSHAERQVTLPENGDAVLVHGAVSVYEANGVYQLYADRVRPRGLGDLHLRFEQLKAKLLAEGLFDAARKRPLPAFPRRIGVVTSADAAAFQDVLNVLRRRYPLGEVILSACGVQGDAAPPQIAAAIERLNVHNACDVILVCRGGGSLEDLWAFNDERVARAIAASRIPIVSGVGHETDVTIADFAADVRAPTPSAAAELLAPDVADLRLALAGLRARLSGALAAGLATRADRLRRERRALRGVSPQRLIERHRQRIDDWNAALVARQRQRLALLRERVKGQQAALVAASPAAILARGYALIAHAETGQRITSARSPAAQPGAPLVISLHDGQRRARLED